MKQILLNPGPVNVTERVRAALGRGDACHREPEIAQTLASVRALLLELFDPGGAFDAVFLTGSGTAALEAAVIAAPSKSGKLLVVENGVYGERISKIAAAHGIETVKLSGPWQERPDLEKLETLLKTDAAVDSIALVHHETTTGLLNPVRDVGALAKKYSKRFVLDTVSGLGGESLNLDAWGVDLAAGTANKCICGFPGISFVLVRKSRWSEIEKNPKRSLYFDLPANLEAQKDACGAFTPAVQVLWAFEEALKELKEEGVETRIERFRRAAALIRKGAQELGLEILLDPAHRSNTITSFALPKGKSYEQLHDQLKERGFVVYAGQGPLATSIFRVANMGQVAASDYERFLGALGEVLR